MGLESAAVASIGKGILDPNTGSVYRCKITVEEGGKKLVVRGFIGISLIGRSQVWTRQAGDALRAAAADCAQTSSGMSTSVGPAGV